VPGATNDLFDRHAATGGALDDSIVGLTTQNSLVLAPFGAGEQIGIDCCSSERPADRAHALPHRLKKGSTRVLHQVPTVGDLVRLGARTRHGMTITGAPITRDDVDAGMVRQPRLNGGWMTIRQEIDDATTLEVADDGAIALAPLPREVVDADDRGRWQRLSGYAPADQSEQRVSTHWQGETVGQPTACGTAECHTDVPLDLNQPTASP
jgi:hypothetical protein